MLYCSFGLNWNLRSLSSYAEMSKLRRLAKQIFDTAVIQIFTSRNKIWLLSSSGKSTGKLLKSASLFSIFSGAVM